MRTVGHSGNNRRRLEAEDLFRIRLISEAQISPDGGRICFVQTVPNRQENDYDAHLWMVPEGEGEPEQFTFGPHGGVGPHRDIGPSWSHDGKQVAFLSNRSGLLQVWIIPATGGEARQVTAVRGVSGRPVWSPDDRRIAFTIRIGEAGLQPVSSPPEPQTLFERYTQDVRRITTLPYKRGGVGFIDRYLQVAVVHLETDAAPRILTSGRLDHSGPAWSPDGLHIAFAMAEPRVVQRPHPVGLVVGDIGVVPAEGGAVRRLTNSVGPAYRPAWAPDGRTIAYLGHARQYGDYTNVSLWTVDVEKPEPRDVTAAYDLPMEDLSSGDMAGVGEFAPVPAWATDGRSVYWLASGSGMTHLVQVELASGLVRPVTAGKRVIYSFRMSRDRTRSVLCHRDATTPSDLFLLTLDDQATETRLTRVNRQFETNVEIAVPERFTFPSGDATVEGWILRPPGAKKTALTPAVLQIHGGPMVMYGYRFMFEFQLLAANGITIVYTNPRGSMGYGQEFAAAIRGAWGTMDFLDLMHAIEAAVKLGGIDPARLGAAGGSYGGYMVNWIIGHDRRFKTAISMRGISNMYSYFGTSDYGFTDLAEFGGPPWRLPGVYLQQSPLSYVERVKTPLLMIHGEDDLRTPLTEAEQFYVALKALDRDVVLLVYPDESHGLPVLGEPWHRVHRLEAVREWFAERL